MAFFFGAQKNKRQSCRRSKSSLIIKISLLNVERQIQFLWMKYTCDIEVENVNLFDYFLNVVQLS